MTYMGISRFDGILDLRPPELVLAIDNIVPVVTLPPVVVQIEGPVP